VNGPENRWACGWIGWSAAARQERKWHMFFFLAVFFFRHKDQGLWSSIPEMRPAREKLIASTYSPGGAGRKSCLGGQKRPNDGRLRFVLNGGVRGRLPESDGSSRPRVFANSVRAIHARDRQKAFPLGLKTTDWPAGRDPRVTKRKPSPARATTNVRLFFWGSFALARAPASPSPLPHTFYLPKPLNKHLNLI